MRWLSFQNNADAAVLAEAIKAFATASDVTTAVTEILADIRSRGHAALLELTEGFDGARLRAEELRVPEADLEAAVADLSAEQRSAIDGAIGSVRDFHDKTVPRDWTDTNPHGATVGERFYPIRNVGLYIPGGQVPLVSTVIMTATPAVVAGCPRIAACTPPRADGSVDPGLLAAFHLCGISEVYKLGGVQAIGALAYGSATVPAVDKLFGPGNAYVMEAKRQLYGTVGVDLLPGPSEVLVIADETANPAWVVADLLAQAEHGTQKEKLFFITTSDEMLAAVETEIARQVPARSHANAIQSVLDNRTLAIVASDLECAAAAANIIAPEHMELQVAEDKLPFMLDSITTAGAILLGHATPTVLGDFAAGPSHTLPTDTTARFSSGIQVSDFMRRSSVVKYNDNANRQAWPLVKAFAAMEQLDAHGESLRLRVEP